MSELESDQVDDQVDISEDAQAEGADLSGGEDLPKVSEAEAKALTKGWQTKEDWEASGKDPEEWISANHFNKNGELFSQMQRLKNQNKNQDQRIADNNEFWKAQLEMQKAELIEQRNEAIEDADVDQVNKLDSKINKITAQENKLNQQSAMANSISQDDAAVEQQYFEKLDLTQQQYAQQVAAYYISNNQLAGEELVKYVDAAVKQQFPQQAKTKTNPRRESAPTTDAAKRTSKSSEGKITVDSLSKEDRASLQAMRNISPRYAQKSDAEMLKIIEDSKR